ncbi:MAG: BON domain-containing protein [Candidatus Omnitrophota bacterium]
MVIGKDKIKQDVEDQISNDNRVSASEINVDVDKGEVILRGRAGSYLARRAAETDAWVVEGVINVKNEIDVSYPIDKMLTDNEIRKNIDEFLLYNPQIDASKVDIGVRSGIVTLFGSVDHYWKKNAVEEAVNDLTGVKGVINELAVVPTKQLSDEVIAQEILSTAELDFPVDMNKIIVEVEEGRVTLKGIVPDWKSGKIIYDKACYTTGVVDVDNQMEIQ